jgi:hypothetical protein
MTVIRLGGLCSVLYSRVFCRAPPSRASNAISCNWICPLAGQHSNFQIATGCETVVSGDMTVIRLGGLCSVLYWGGGGVARMKELMVMHREFFNNPTATLATTTLNLQRNWLNLYEPAILGSIKMAEAESIRDTPSLTEYFVTIRPGKTPQPKFDK